jgi:hypothetical protein
MPSTVRTTVNEVLIHSDEVDTSEAELPTNLARVMIGLAS